MGSSRLRWALSLILLATAGCAKLAPYAPDTGPHDGWDAIFKRRHVDPKAPVRNDPMLSFARQITVLEDDIRRDGSITVKAPDVWGESNLMRFIQEYDGQLAESVKHFDETLQAYIARSDRAELESATGLGMALGGATTPPMPQTQITIDAKGDSTTTSTLIPKLIDLPPAEVADLIDKFKTAVPPEAEKVGVEPTELERQRSTFILVNQALRRRNMGDDGSRAAGYALYKFRVPVSILPGRETSQGHAAVVSMRAQLQVDEANLRYTFPKMVVADLVERLTPVLLDEWVRSPTEKKSPTEKNPKLMEQLAQAIDLLVRTVDEVRDVGHTDTSTNSDVRTLAEKAAEAADQLRKAKEALAGTDRLLDEIPGKAGVVANRLDTIAKKLGEQDPVKERVTTASEDAHRAVEAINRILRELGHVPGPARAGDVASIALFPKEVFGNSVDDLLKVVKEYFRETPPKNLELRNFLFQYLGQVHSVVKARHLYTSPVINEAGQKFEMGEGLCVGAPSVQEKWRNWLDETKVPADGDSYFRSVSWLVAVQSGIQNQNLKKILRELQLRGKLSDDPATIDTVEFFNPDGSPDAVRLWSVLIRETFPLHVFALDPQVEEQNVYDAFTRRREMQLALAIAVASGRMNTGQRLAMSRQLGLDEAAIALNRTAVAFSHGSDTFGWYFYPRVQTPPTESTNIGALARTIWSTGPTEAYDLKHRNLEPGMRECEVLIAMPSFVTEVSFEVTTNWEKLAHPGTTKRSYEEMVAQGGRLHQLRMCLQEAGNQDCYRPGDYERLLSRIDQLEQMLGMQTYVVNVPYEYEQTGTDLFDTGKVHLRPQLTGYYGLQYVESDKDAVGAVFVTGKNFHPTATYAIVGGTESTHGGTGGDVEVISRELLRIKINKLNPKLSPDNKFEIRVGTPAGLSDPLIIEQPKKPEEKAEGFTLDEDFSFRATIGKPEGVVKFAIVPGSKSPLLLPISYQGKADVLPTRGRLVAVLTATKKSDGKAMKFRVSGKLQDSITTEDVDLTVDGNKKLWLPFHGDRGDSLRQRIEAAVQANEPDYGNDPSFVITVTCYVKFDQWPVFKLLKTIAIDVEALEPGAKSDPAKPAVELSTGSEASGLREIPTLLFGEQVGAGWTN